MSFPVVALLSPGAMGSAIAARLTGHDVRVITALDGRSQASRARAAAAGMIDVPEASLLEAEVILSVVPPGEAEALVRRLLPLLASAERKPLYVDANALSPDSKCALAALLAGSGCTMIDGSIIGPPPVTDTTATTLYLSGPAAANAMWLAERGLDVRLLDGPVGAASALKMCFAGINKGMIGLAAAMLLAAERSGAGEALHAQMQKSMPDLLSRYRRQIPDMLPKAWRWVAEMREIAAYLEADSGDALIFEGMAQLYDRIAADVDGDGSERQSLEAALNRTA